MSQPELGRYLDYCSELVALSSKVAALFVQHFNDPIVLAHGNQDPLVPYEFAKPPGLLWIFATATKRVPQRVAMAATWAGVLLHTFGIAASQKIGNAVVRNRAKRLVRELFRGRKPLTGIDIVVIPRREMVDAPWRNIEADYRAALERFERR